MGATYVTFSPHSNPEFPAMCPFSGAANPRKWVTVRKTRSRWVLPVPFLGFIVGSNAARFRVPAAAHIAIIDKVLARIGMAAGILLVLAYFIAHIAAAAGSAASNTPQRYEPDDNKGMSWATLLLIVLGTYIAARIFRRINLRAVKIVDLQPNSTELCFNREDYAKAFCEMNKLPGYALSARQRRLAGGR
jgi:hypothetical protein